MSDLVLVHLVNLFPTLSLDSYCIKLQYRITVLEMHFYFYFESLAHLSRQAHKVSL